VVCYWAAADQRWPFDPSAAHHWHVADRPQPRSAGPHIGGGAPLLPRPRAHARRLGAGGGSGCTRPGAPALSAGGAADACPPPLRRGAGGCRRCGAGGHRGGQQRLPPTCAYAQRRRGAAAGRGDDHQRRGAGSGVPQPRPRATPLGGAAKVSIGAATGGPMAPHRGRGCRCLPAGRRRGGRPRQPSPQRRGGDEAVAATIPVMGTLVDTAVTAMAALAAGRGGSGAAHPSRGRAAPGAQPPRRPPRRGQRRLRRRCHHRGHDSRHRRRGRHRCRDGRGHGRRPLRRAGARPARGRPSLIAASAAAAARTPTAAVAAARTHRARLLRERTRPP